MNTTNLDSVSFALQGEAKQAMLFFSGTFILMFVAFILSKYQVTDVKKNNQIKADFMISTSFVIVIIAFVLLVIGEEYK